MKSRFLLLTLIVVVIAGFEAFALFSKPKVAFKANVKETAVLNSETKPETITETVKTDLYTDLQKEENFVTEQEKSDLKLELIGTAIGNVKDPSAFIKDLESGKQGIYKLGSMIQQGKVVEIVMGRVTLDVLGREQILTISERGKAWAGTNNFEEPLIAFSGEQILVNKIGLLNKSGTIIKDLQKVKISPYYEAHKVAGLRVEGLGKDSIIASAGLRNKDVVTMVNSQKIDSYQKALQVFNKARGQDEIKVNVIRDGQPEMLSYKIR